MKLFNRFLSVLSVLLIVLLTNCVSNQDENEPTKALDAGREAPYFHILADQNLTEGHKLAILASIDEWSVKTNFTVRYSLQFVDMSMQPKDLHTEHTIRIYVQDPGPDYVGWTEWITSNQSAYILVEPSISDEEFRMIMLHELGHAFDLHFAKDIHYKGDYQSVMWPSIGDASTHLSCIDLKAFCENYGCQVDCTFVKK